MKNCIIIVTALMTAAMVSSCTLSFSAETASQKYNANVNIYNPPVVEEDSKK